MNNKGQAVLSEYVMAFFAVIAAGVAMTTFVQRGLEARVHDARSSMIDSLVNSGACDANCLMATGAVNGQISHEYEPYYAQTIADVHQNQQDSFRITPSNAQVAGEAFSKSFNETTQTNSVSTQLPPQCVNGGC